MAISFDSIKNCISQTHSTERHLWVTDKQGKVQWINRKSYSCLRQKGRLQVAFGSIKNLVDGLPKIDTAAAEKIQLLSNLKKQITNKYLNFSKAHRTPLFGYLYRLLFARSLDNNYKAVLLSIDTYLKNHISKLSVDEFKTFISFFKPQETVSYLSLLDEEALNRLVPHLPDDLLVKLETSQIAKMQLDKFTSKHICLIKDKLTTQQLNKLDLSQWPYEDVTNLYNSKNVAEANAACIKTINPIGWPFKNLKLFLVKGLDTYSKNVRTGSWPLELNKRLREDDLLSEWAYARAKNLLDLPPTLLEMIADFNPKSIYRLAVVSKKTSESFLGDTFVKTYFRRLKDGIGEDSFNYLKVRAPEINFSTIKCIERLTKHISRELESAHLEKITQKGIMGADQLASFVNFLDDSALVSCAHIFFDIKEIHSEIGKEKRDTILKKMDVIQRYNPSDLSNPSRWDIKTRYKLAAQFIREEINKITPETLQKVTNLDLSTYLHDPISRDIFIFENLKHLNLNNSENRSVIPLQIFKTMTKLETLNISRNAIKKLPPEIAQLSNLTDLDISYNQFPGIPQEITTLTNLRKLRFTYPAKAIIGIESTGPVLEPRVIQKFIDLSCPSPGKINACIEKIINELTKHNFSDHDSLLNYMYSPNFAKFVDDTAWIDYGVVRNIR